MGNVQGGIACSRKSPTNINIVPNSVQDAPVAVDLKSEVGTGDGGHPVAVIVDLWYPQLVDVVESIEVPLRNGINFKML